MTCQVLSQPGCEGGKLHFSHNQVGEKTVMAVHEWNNEVSFSNWIVGSTSLKVFDQVVDFFKQNSIDIHQWKRCPNPTGYERSNSTVAIRAAALFDRSLNVEAYVAMLWFRAAEGQDMLLITALWGIQFCTKMDSPGSCIRFDIYTGHDHDTDVKGETMVYLAFESEQHFQEHLSKEYSVIGDRVCQFLENSPLLTTWKTVDLSS